MCANLLRLCNCYIFTSTAEGAWLVAHRAEQRRRFKAILCNKPKTYARIKEERKKAEKQGTTLGEQSEDVEEEGEEEKDVPILDGFFLVIVIYLSVLKAPKSVSRQQNLQRSAELKKNISSKLYQTQKYS